MNSIANDKAHGGRGFSSSYRYAGAVQGAVGFPTFLQPPPKSSPSRKTALCLTVPLRSMPSVVPINGDVAPQETRRVPTSECNPLSGVTISPASRRAHKDRDSSSGVRGTRRPTGVAVPIFGAHGAAGINGGDDERAGRSGNRMVSARFWRIPDRPHGRVEVGMDHGTDEIKVAPQDS